MYSWTIGVGRFIHVNEPCEPAVITSVGNRIFNITIFGNFGPNKENGIYRTVREIEAATWHPADHCPHPVGRTITLAD